MRIQEHQGPPNLDSCGFVCPTCSFRLFLSDLTIAVRIVETLKHGAPGVNITCPECGNAHSYSRTDLKLFLPHGRQAPIGKRDVTIP